MLLHAYLEWKTDAFSRLNGIFAFAIWEKRERRLTLCRDRLGVKPLFFAPIRNGLTFGSTIDTDAVPSGDRGLRSTRTACERCCCSDRHARRNPVFSADKVAAPGHFAVLAPENFTDHVYWQLEAHEHEDDLPTTIERARTRSSAMPPAVSWSAMCRWRVFSRAGWIRPSCPCWRQKITRPAAKRLHTWSVDYRDNDKYFTKSIFQPNSDDSYIDQMVDFLGTHHHRVVLEPEALCAALLPRRMRVRCQHGRCRLLPAAVLCGRQARRNHRLPVRRVRRRVIRRLSVVSTVREILFEDTFPVVTVSRSASGSAHTGCR